MRTGEDSAARLNVMINKADNGGAKIDKSGVAPGFSWASIPRMNFSSVSFI